MCDRLSLNVGHLTTQNFLWKYELTMAAHPASKIMEYPSMTLLPDLSEIFASNTYVPKSLALFL